MILQRMGELAADYGEELTEHIFLPQTRWSSRLIQSRFGNWGDLREEVGLSRRAKLLFEMYRRWRDGAKTESGWEEIDAMLRPILEQR